MDKCAIEQMATVKKVVKICGLEISALPDALRDARHVVRVTSRSVNYVRMDDMVTVVKRTVVRDVNLEGQVQNSYATNRMVSVSLVVLTEYGVRLVKIPVALGAPAGYATEPVEIA